MKNKLLFLEDDQALAQVTRRALEKRHFEVTHVNSLEALKAVEEIKHYSHALLDLKLEDGNALSLISELLNRNPELNIVILTGYASITSTVQAIKLGANNYLAKPATIEQILNAFDEEYSDSMDEGQNMEQQGLSLKGLEWEHIQRVLNENDGNISATARQLNMHRRTLQRKLNKKTLQ